MTHVWALYHGSSYLCIGSARPAGLADGPGLFGFRHEANPVFENLRRPGFAVIDAPLHLGKKRHSASAEPLTGHSLSGIGYL